MRQYIGLLFAGLLLGGLSCTALADGLVEVRQGIFGMDCAPCAYGVQRGLERLSGVRHVAVSLNDGQAVIRLAPDNAVTLTQIQEVIRHGGFTPKQATLQVSGEVAAKDGQFRLLVNGKPEYQLVFSGTKPPADLVVGKHVTVEGTVAALSSDPIRKLAILKIGR